MRIGSPFQNETEKDINNISKLNFDKTSKQLKISRKKISDKFEFEHKCFSLNFSCTLQADQCFSDDRTDLKTTKCQIHKIKPSNYNLYKITSIPN